LLAEAAADWTVKLTC